ncbi:hypothetical protein J3A83DRAFT_4435575 [Scleroderma citrinum]
MASAAKPGAGSDQGAVSTRPQEDEVPHKHARGLPTYDELPAFRGLKGCAWELWGKDDELGTVNLLTEDVVQRAAKQEIRTGRTVCLNWPLQFPSRPAFGRKIPSILTFAKDNPGLPIRDDVIHINTQSGSQWDGLKHYGLEEYNVFYNNTPAESLSDGNLEIHDPSEIDRVRIKLGIHNFAKHGICGRAVLLDLVEYYTSDTGSELSYDPWSPHALSVADLEACARKEGVVFRQGDILLLRVGFIQKYYASSIEEKHYLAVSRSGIRQLGSREDRFRNNHFAAIASDQPSMERWPPLPGVQPLHPVREMFDLEGLSQVCKETGRYTFFFTSWPLHIIGGAASPPNAAAYF